MSDKDCRPIKPEFGVDPPRKAGALGMSLLRLVWFAKAPSFKEQGLRTGRFGEAFGSSYDRQLHALDRTGMPDASSLVRGWSFALRQDGPEFTLLRFNPTLEIGPLLRAAETRNVPLEMLGVTAPDEIVREGALVLSRPDQQVAWRGHCAPADSLSLIDHVRGASRQVADQSSLAAIDSIKETS